MNTQAIKRSIDAGAAEIRRLHSSMLERFANRKRSPEDFRAWELAAQDLRRHHDGLCLPELGYRATRDALLKSDALAIETVLCFIELRPHFFRSEAIRSNLLPVLVNAVLTGSQSLRLADALERDRTLQQARAQRFDRALLQDADESGTHG